MSVQDRFVLLSVLLLSYQAVMAIRYFYLGYFKYPRLIESYRLDNDKSGLEKLEKAKLNCRKTAWRFVLLFFASAICLGGYELGMFFMREGNIALQYRNK